MILKSIPTEKELMRLYWELSLIGAPAVGKKSAWPYRLRSKEALIVLACEMVRYDPRLLSILLIYFNRHWFDLNPVKMRQWIPQMRYPQVLGVLKEFIADITKDPEISYFFEYLAKGLKPVALQLFFIGLYPPGSIKSEIISKKSLKQYLKWGFLSMEKPISDLKTKRTVGSYSFQSRQRLIQDLIESQGEIFLRDYLKAVGHTLSRQQALYDLKHCARIKLKGRGRGAKWVRK